MKSLALFILGITFSIQLSAQGSTNLNSNQPNVEVELIDGEQIISWKLQKEINTSFFIVEKSLNGRDFVQVSTVKAKGHSTFPTEYSLETSIDDSIQKPIYRVTLVQMDGVRISADSNSSSNQSHETIAENLND